MSLQTLKVNGTGEKTKSTFQVREHQIVIDEPEDFGGANTGPNPMEYVLASLAGCENVMLHMIAKEQGVEMGSVDFSVEGTLNTDGLEGMGGVRPYFQNIKVQAEISTDASDEQIQSIRSELEKRCPAYTMLKAASIEIDSEWTKSK
ncbi:OsmC family protein [Bacillaceae bacterium S4-13-58]